MTKIATDSLGTLREESALTTLNNNFTAIDTASEDFLSRSGEAPNEMEASLDMNSNQIINLPEATTLHEPATYGQLQDVVDDFEVLLEANAVATTTSNNLHIPTTVNTYSSNLRDKLEWDDLSAWDFLTSTMRSDSDSNDCYEAIQAYIDFLESQTTSRPHKSLNLAGKVYRIGTGLSIVGGATRNGHIVIKNGTLLAADSWAAQTSYPLPLVEFSTNSEGSGIDNVLVDCNGVCSGILVITDVSSAQVKIRNTKVMNFGNPSYTTQAALYSNTVTVGAATHSAVAARRYWGANGHKNPYGIRVGKKDTSDNTIAGASGVTITNCDIRQWHRDHANHGFWSKYTGIGVWLECSDGLVSSCKSIGACLKPVMVGDGDNNEVSGNHFTPVDNFDASDKPDATVEVISAENGGGNTRFINNYNESYLWFAEPKGIVVGCIFPRGASFTDGNDAGIVLDAKEAGQTWGATSRLTIVGRSCLKASTLDQLVKYREDGGFTWANKVDFGTATTLVDATYATQTIANMDGSTDEVLRVSSAHSTRSHLVFDHAGTTKAVEVGASGDKFHVRVNNTVVLDADETNGLDLNGLALRINSNDVITSARHPQLRTYTMATLPGTATAGQLIYVSDYPGGGAVLYGNGSAWVKAYDRISGTASASAGAATLNKTAGKITTEALTTAAAGTYTLTLTNSVIAATDMVFASVTDGTATAGTPMIEKITPGSGSVVIRVKNDHATNAFDGTLVISFLVIKA